jgi:hypothetical protein
VRIKWVVNRNQDNHALAGVGPLASVKPALLPCALWGVITAARS